jgi:hypothetical protein
MQTLKDKMYNYEVTPPPESWQIIAKALNENQTSNSTPVKKRSKNFYVSLSAAAAMLIFVFGLIFWQNISKNNELNDKITVPKTTSIHGSKKGKEGTPSEDVSKYITITSPQGQCVKISSKAAMLIVSSDDQNPPKPVWSAKVNKWKDIMESNVFAPATANFLDVVELTQALKTDN